MSTSELFEEGYKEGYRDGLRDSGRFVSTSEPPLDGLLYGIVKRWDKNYEFSAPDVTPDISKANVITSLVADKVTTQKVLLDIDMPAKLIPSSTPGHWHLYIDHTMETAAYLKLLIALAEAGIIEDGFLKGAQARGYTDLRLPWVKK